MSDRSYNWATILYPESCKENYTQILEQLHIPVAVSPLHNADVDENGEIKKSHKHLILHYNTLKSYKQVQENISMFGGVGVENIRDLGAYVRYLVHADNPEKTQYDVKEIVSYNGFNVEKYLNKKNKIDVDEGFKELISIAINNSIGSYGQLLLYCLHNEPDLIPNCRCSAYALNAFLRSINVSNDIDKSKDYKKFLNIDELTN